MREKQENPSQLIRNHSTTRQSNYDSSLPLLTYKDES